MEKRSRKFVTKRNDKIRFDVSFLDQPVIENPTNEKEAEATWNDALAKRKKPVKKKKDLSPVKPIEKPVETQDDNREELDFQFDEELPNRQTQSKAQLSSSVPVAANRRRTTSLNLDNYEAT